MSRLIVTIVFAVLILIPHAWKRDIRPELPALPKMGAGCVGDLTVGYVDCLTVFDNGTFVRSRMY